MKFDGDADPGLRKTVGSGNRKTFTISVWVKHDSFDNNDRIFATYTDGGNYSGLYFRDEPDYQIAYAERLSNNFDILCNSTAIFNPNAWYHIVLAVNTTISSPASDRVKMYVNGVQESLTGPYSNGAYTADATFPSQGYETQLAKSGTTEISAMTGFTTGNWDGNMSQFYMIDVPGTWT